MGPAADKSAIRNPQSEIVKSGPEELAAGLLLYAVEITGDHGAAEDLLAEAAARVFRWGAPEDLPAGREALFKAVTAQAHGPLNRPGRTPLPAALRADPDRFDTGLEAALAALPGRERAALFLAAFEGLAYERVAAVLDTTVANTGHLIWRARRSLRERLVGQLPATAATSGLDVPVPSTEQRISKVLRAGCAQAGAFLSALADGALTGRQREILEPHLASCAVCAEEFARLGQVTAAIRSRWQGLAARLTAAGWTRRALMTLSLGRHARARGPRGRRMQLGAVWACLAGLVALAALWALLGRGSADAVAVVEGRASRAGGRIRAAGPATVRLLDGSEVRLEAGSCLAATRESGTSRPKLKLLAGTAEILVAPGAGDLVVESAAGTCRAGSGAFGARLAARNAQGRPLALEFDRARALGSGERLALVVESRTVPVALAGQFGPELVVPPGGAGLVPVSEAARPLAIPGSWVGLPAAGGGEPPARSGGALGCDRGSGLVGLFGGLAADSAPGQGELNDLWAYDPGLGSWQEMAVSSGAAKWLADSAAKRLLDRPAPQLPGALLADPRGRGLWLYAGRLGGSDLAEMWFLEVPGPWQRARDYSAAGDRGAKASGPVAPSAPRPGPAGRHRAAMAACARAGGIILFGGESGGRPQADTWLFDVAASAWKPFPMRGAGPEARSAAALAADRGGRRVYLFGGRNAAGAVLGDTWCLELLSPQGGAWQRLGLRAGAAPEPRAGAVLACEESAGKLVLFGGRPRLGGPSAETWVFEPDAGGASGRWVRLAAPGGPAADEFTAPAMAWHPQCGILVLFSRGGLWGLRLEK